MRDAETLEWDEGQLERRKRAVQNAISGRLGDNWRQESDLRGLFNGTPGDDLFKKHGWNKVDSGFRLWGGGKAEGDEFLKSKGWNNVDSRFRII